MYENQTTVMTLTASDDEHDQVAFSISGGNDASAFSLTSDGILSFQTAPDYETKSSYSLTVTATESATQSGGVISNPNSSEQDITVTIADANDAAVISVVDQGMAEGDAAVSGTVSHTDSDANNGDNVFQVIASGTASTKGYGSYSLSSEGSWTYTLNNTDATIDGLRVGQTETDSIKVIAEDGTFEYATITISGTNDAPVLSGDRTGNVVEDIGPGTAVGTLVGSDVDAGDSLTFSVDDTTGTYGSLAMGSETGAWTYTLNDQDPDTDALADGASVSDSFTVALDDGQGGRVTGDVTIAIAGTNDGPVITSGGSISVPENSTAVTTIIASDVDDSQLDYTIVSGADQSSFTLDAVTGELVFNTAPDYESPASTSGDNNYDVTVSVSDGQLADSQDLTVMVAVANSAPTEINLDSGRVIEDSAGAVVGVLTVVDPNANDSHTLVLSGADEAHFEIDTNNQLKLKDGVSLDYQTQPGAGYATTVTATDNGGLSTAENFVIRVAGVFETPVDKPFSLMPEVDPATRELSLTWTADLAGITSVVAQEFDYTQQLDIDIDWNQFDWIDPDNKTVDIATLDTHPTYLFTTSKEVDPLSIAIVDFTALFGTYTPMLDSTTPSKDIATVTLDPSEHVSSVALTYEGSGGINNGTDYEQTPVSMIVGMESGILTGTPGDDLIWGSAGDDILTGNGGNDTFLYNSDNKSDDLIKDFTVSDGGDEKDSLDLSDLLVGFDVESSILSDFLEVTENSSNTLVKVDQNSDGSGYSDMTLTLESVTTTLEELQDNEQLIL